jgi:hypothetical protein
MIKHWAPAAAAATLIAAALPAQAGKTLDAIKARGQVVCRQYLGTGFLGRR